MADASDNFNRAGPGLGANWTTSPSLSAPVIASSTIVQGGTDNADHGAWWDANAFEDNQFAQITITNANVGDHGGGPIVRHAAAATTGYFIYCQTDDFVSYFEMTAGSFAILGTGIVATVNAGTVLKLSIAGSVLTANIGGTDLATRTDATVTAGSAGFHIFDNLATFDDWSGGPIISGLVPRENQYIHILSI